MKFNSKSEWQNYLIDQIGVSIGGYAIVHVKGNNELLYFAKHTSQERYWLLESPNVLRKYKIEREEDICLYEKNGFLIKDVYAYDIDSPQCNPFLGEEVEIHEFIGDDEVKALEYLLNNQ